MLNGLLLVSNFYSMKITDEILENWTSNGHTTLNKHGILKFPCAQLLLRPTLPPKFILKIALKNPFIHLNSLCSLNKPPCLCFHRGHYHMTPRSDLHVNIHSWNLTVSCQLCETWNKYHTILTSYYSIRRQGCKNKKQCALWSLIKTIVYHYHYFKKTVKSTGQKKKKDNNLEITLPLLLVFLRWVSAFH